MLLINTAHAQYTMFISRISLQYELSRMNKFQHKLRLILPIYPIFILQAPYPALPITFHIFLVFKADFLSLEITILFILRG